jgi:hypothetical protein
MVAIRLREQMIFSAFKISHKQICAAGHAGRASSVRRPTAGPAGDP